MKRPSISLLLAALTVTACGESSTPTAPTDDPLLASMAAAAYDCTVQTQVPEAECGVLVALYNGTGGPAWANNTNWLATSEPCGWYGVGCFDGSVTELGLNGNKLNGSIPSELGDLSNLYYLGLGDNQLSGPIPAELGNLSNLVYTHLFSNQLSGPIPAELGNLSNLEGIQAIGNQLSGAIPAELGNLSNLKRLNLAYNQLSGAIPATLGNLSKLEDLGLQSNQLSGAIPAELGDLGNLVYLALYSNQLTGPIPAALGNLSNLAMLDFGDNQLTGAIPAEFGNLSKLWSLNLVANQLSGPIPAALGNLSNLEQLWVFDNQLSGPIPAALGNLSKLKALVLHENQLSGPIPAELGNVSSLERLDLRLNQLSGPIPAELGNLVNLSVLWLGFNQLSGLVPIGVAALGGSAPLAGDCWFVPGNHGLYMPDIEPYRAYVDDDGLICGLGLSSFVPVAIDIKPGSDPNSIACNTPMEAIAVGILTTDAFDATTVDHTTVTFEGASEMHTTPQGVQRHEKDVDLDGDLDLVLHFRLGETVLTCASTDGTLSGETFDGQTIEGTDAVHMIEQSGRRP
ncbi:MAG: hypothetical protein OER89_03175 [Gemmatimonadota bacterium]|nr:hypothetical protein [Gemmatimonadota bacterium]